MNITCVQKPISGSFIKIVTSHGRVVDSFDAPTSNGLLYCMAHKTGKYTRRLQMAVAIAARLESGEGSEQLSDDAPQAEAA